MEIGRKRILGEAAFYGMLGMIYASLFFFGALYPQFGIPSQSIVRETETDEDEETTEEKTDEEKVVYKSLLVERLKEWF